MALLKGSLFAGALFAGSLLSGDEITIVIPEPIVTQGGFWTGEVIGKAKKKKKVKTGFEILDEARREVESQRVINEIQAKDAIIEPLPVQYAIAKASVDKVIGVISDRIYNDDLDAIALIMKLLDDEI